MKLSKEDFIGQVKEQYPAYKDIDDDELYNSLIEQYPDYKDYIQESPVSAAPAGQDADLYNDTAESLLEKGLAQVNTPPLDEFVDSDLDAPTQNFKILSGNGLFDFQQYRTLNYDDYKAAQDKYAKDMNVYENNVFKGDGLSVLDDESIELQYKTFKDQGVLRKTAEAEDVSLDQFKIDTKERNQADIKKRVDLFKDNDETVFFRRKNGRFSYGKIKESNLDDAENKSVTITLTNGNDINVNLEDVASINNYQRTVDNLTKVWKDISDKSYPEFSNMEPGLQSVLYKLASENDIDSFVKLYLLNQPMPMADSEKNDESPYILQETDEEQKIYNLSIGPYYENLESVKEVLSDYYYNIDTRTINGEKEYYFEHLRPKNFDVKNKATVTENLMDSVAEQLQRKIDTNEVTSSVVNVQVVNPQEYKTVKDANVRPDVLLNNEMIRKGQKLFNDIKSYSPQYMLLETLEDFQSRNYKEYLKEDNKTFEGNVEGIEDGKLHSDDVQFISNVNKGGFAVNKKYGIELSNLDNTLPLTFDLAVNTPKEFKDRVDNAFKMYGNVKNKDDVNFSTLDHVTFEQDGSVRFRGTWVLHPVIKKNDNFPKDIFLGNSLTGQRYLDGEDEKIANPLTLTTPLSFYGSTEESEKKFKEDIVAKQIQANTTTVLGVEVDFLDIARAVSGTGISNLIYGGKSSPHFYGIEGTESIASEGDFKYQVPGLSGKDATTLKTDGDLWYWEFIPDDKELAAEIVVSEEKSSLKKIMDVGLDMESYIRSGFAGTSDFAASAATYPLAGLWGIAGLAVNRSSYDSFTETYNRKVSANMQKVMRPVVSDAGGQYALETLFTPMTYAIDAVHSAGDAITNYTGNRFIGDTASILGEAGLFFLIGKSARGGYNVANRYISSPKKIDPYTGKSSREYTVNNATTDFMEAFNKKSAFGKTLSTGTTVLLDKAYVKYFKPFQYELLKTPLAESIAKGFKIDLKKNFALVKSDFPVRGRNKVQETVFTVGPTHFQVLPNFTFKAGKLTKEFKFKKYKLPHYKVKVDKFFTDMVMPEMLADFSILNYRDFRTKWGESFKAAKIPIEQVTKWQPTFLKDKKFAGYEKKQASYLEQSKYSRLADITDEMFNKKYPSNVKHVPIPTSEIARTTHLELTPKKDGVDVVVSNKQTKKEYKQKYDNMDDAVSALNFLNRNIATKATIFRNAININHNASINGFLQNPNVKNYMFFKDKNIYDNKVSNLDRTTISSIEVPEQTPQVVFDITNQIITSHQKLFDKYPDNMIVTVEKELGNLIINAEFLTSIDNRANVLKFAEANNSQLVDGNNNTVLYKSGGQETLYEGEKIDFKKFKGFNLTHNLNKDKLDARINSLIKGKDIDIDIPNQFEILINKKRQINQKIDKAFSQISKLEKSLEKSKGNDAKIYQSQIDGFVELKNALYESREQINKALSTGDVDITKLYSGNFKNRKVTNIAFNKDSDKIYSKIQPNSPREFAAKLDPKLYSSLMKKKKYKERDWQVSTQLIQAYLKKNPTEFENAKYIVYNRNDNRNVVTPEFYNIENGKYYSPDKNVAQLYANQSGKNREFIDVPEIQNKYSLAEPVKKVEPVKTNQSRWEDDVEILGEPGQNSIAVPRSLDSGIKTRDGIKSIPVKDIDKIVPVRELIEKRKPVSKDGKKIIGPLKKLKSEKGIVYHVTETKNVPSIKKQGLVVDPKRKPLWLKQENMKGYGKGEIFAFTDINDALKWSSKMNLDLQIPLDNMSIVQIKKDPQLTKRKATVKKATPAPKKIAKVVDQTKKKITELKPEQLAELSLEAQIGYLRAQETSLLNKIQEKFTTKELDKLGSGFINDKKVTQSERKLFSNITQTIQRTERLRKQKIDNDELFSWYKPGTGNQKILVKMPIEIRVSIDGLAAPEKKIASMRAKLSTLEPDTYDFYFQEALIKKEKKNYDEYHRENITGIIEGLKLSIKQYRADLKALKAGALKLTSAEQKLRIDASKKAQKLLVQFEEIRRKKTPLYDMRITSELVPGMRILLDKFDRMSKYFKAKKEPVQFSPEQIDFLVNQRGFARPFDGGHTTGDATFITDNLYRRAADAYNGTEAKIAKELKFAEKLDNKVKTIQESWDINTYIEMNLLLKRTQIAKGLVVPDALKNGNPYIKGDTYTAFVQRMKKNKKGLQVAKELSKKYEDLRMQINQSLSLVGRQEYIQFLESYIPHYWDLRGDVTFKNFIDKVKGVGPKDRKMSEFESRMRTGTQQFKKRIIPTYADGIALGLKPKILKLGETYAKYAETNLIVARNQFLLDQIRTSLDEFGNPVAYTPKELSNVQKSLQDKLNLAVESRVDKKNRDNIQAEIEYFNDKNFKEFNSDYILRMNEPGKKYRAASPNKKILIRNDFAKILGPILPQNKMFNSKFARGAYVLNNTMRSAFFTLSFFHYGTLAESAITTMARLKNPLAGFIAIGEFNPKPRGVPFTKILKSPRMSPFQFRYSLGKKILDTEFYEDMVGAGMARDVSKIDYQHRYFTGFIEKTIRDIQFGRLSDFKLLNNTAMTSLLKLANFPLKKLNEHLWTTYHPALKIASASYWYNDFIKKYPDLDPYVAKAVVAEFVNNSFGGQGQFQIPISKAKEWFNDARYRSAAGFILLAPDWTYSVQNQFWNSFGRSKKWDRYYGTDLYRKLSNKLYRRNISYGAFILASMIEFSNWYLNYYLEGKEDEYELFGDGLFHIKADAWNKFLYEKALPALGASDDTKVPYFAPESIKTDYAKAKEKQRVINFAKQFKEVAEPLSSLLNIPFNLTLGNNIDAVGRNFADMTLQQRDIFTAKVSPVLRTVGELSLNFFLDQKNLSFPKQPGQILIDSFTPISFRQDGQSFLNTFPIKQKLSLFNARKRMDNLTKLYYDEQAEFDLFNKYGGGYAKNYSAKQFLANKHELYEDLIKVIKKSNPKFKSKTEINAAWNRAEKDLFKQFNKEFNPKVFGNSYSKISVEKLTDLAYKLARLHNSRLDLYEYLNKRGFTVGYEEGYEQYSKLLDDLYRDLDGKDIYPLHRAKLPTRFGNEKEFLWWQKNFKYYLTEEAKKQIVLDYLEED